MSRIPVRLRTILAMLIILVTVAACARRQGVSWPETMAVDAEQHILLAYEDELVLVSRVNGFVVTQDRESFTPDREAADAWRLDGGVTDSKFYAEPLWINETPDGERLMLVSDYNNKLLVINFDQACFATRTGLCVQEPQTWELPGHVLAAAAEDDTHFYVPLSEQNVVALHKGIFEEEWDREDDAERGARDDRTLAEDWEFETERGVWATPVVLDEALVIPGMDHNLYLVDKANGNELARLDLGGAIASTPVLYDGTEATDYFDDVAPPEDPDYDLETARLYVGTFGRRIYEVPLDFSGVDVDDLPYFETDGWVWGAPKIVDGVMYAADLDGVVYAVDVSDGLQPDEQPLWKTNPDLGGVRGSPVVTEEYVIVATRSGRVVWINRTDSSRGEAGSFFLDMDIDEEILSEILVLPGDEDLETLIVVSSVSSGRLLVAFTVDGGRRWAYPSS